MIESFGMDKKQAADYLKISPRTLNRLVQTGALSIAYVANKATFDNKELKAYRDAQKNPQFLTRPGTKQETGDAPGASQSLALTPAAQSFARTSDGHNFFAALAAMIDERAAAPRLSLESKLSLTLAEAAQLSGYSKNFLRVAIHLDKLKAARGRGRGWNIKTSDLKSFVEDL
jgi:excisionase family DNA binding protein